MDLKAFYDAMRADIVKAAGPQVANADPTEDLVSLDSEGKLQWHKSLPDDRGHKATDLETICAFADRFSKSSSIWYSREQVICLIDDADRRDNVRLDMTPSKQANRLIELYAKEPLIGQRDLILMLRTVFYGALPAYPRLIDILRVGKFVAGSEASENFQRGKSSVGKEFKNEMVFAEELPEYISLDVPLFENAFIANKTYKVRCVLEPWEAEAKIQLYPLPGEMEKAFAAGEADLSKMIRDLLGNDTKTPVYYGTP